MDKEVNLAVKLCETFQGMYADYFGSMSGGGSGLGIASVINGTTNVANSSEGLIKKKKYLPKKFWQ